MLCVSDVISPNSCCAGARGPGYISDLRMQRRGSSRIRSFFTDSLASSRPIESGREAFSIRLRSGPSDIPGETAHTGLTFDSFA